MKKQISLFLVLSMLMMLVSGLSISAADAAEKVPLILGPGERPIAIIKADDLTPATFDKFQLLYDVFTKVGVVGSFGAITHRCEGFTDAQWAAVEGWVENGFEIWHHGYDHDGVYIDGKFQNDADFIGRSADKMEMYINHGIDLFAAHGIKVQSVGVPYNIFDETFLTLLNEKFDGKITSVLNAKKPAFMTEKNLSFDCYQLGNRIDLEDGSMTALEAAKDDYQKAPNRPYYVVQMHAAVQAKDLAALEEAILYLKNEVGCIFMTPSQYLEYCIAEANRVDIIEVVDETAVGGKIRVVYNGAEIDFEKYDGVYPVIENGRTLIPIRALAETIGAKVDWLEATKKITITKQGSRIIMFLDKTTATINGNSTTLDVAPTTINDRTMVPLRFASEALNLEVKYTQK